MSQQLDDLHAEDAMGETVAAIAALPSPTGPAVPHDARPYGCDFWLQYVIERFWQRRGITTRELQETEKERAARPFYDAAWELCRIGVLRPGAVAILGRGTSQAFTGDGYSVTEFGRAWAKAAKERLTPTDPGRFAQVIEPFADRLGRGFVQRAVEASHCYRMGCFLACCAMAGAAAESILLAVASAQVGDEHRVLADYRSSNGRDKILKRIVGSRPAGLGERVTAGAGLLAYWRDEAAHGTESGIAEAEAQAVLTQLLRFAQVAHDNWLVLTANPAQPSSAPDAR